MYDKITVDTFLKNQLQLFDEVMAENEEEAQEFLDEMCAEVVKNAKEVKEYLNDAMDVTGMSMEEILDSPEVFALPDGRYLIVEG